MSRFVPDQPRQPGEPEPPSVREEELDALLLKVEEKKARREDAAEDQPDAVAVFRTRMRQIYQPVFQELGQKYAAKGVTLELDAEEFLGGGTSLKMHFTFGEQSMELDGTVMRGGVAFYVIRGTTSGKGAVLSGPMLRIRNLSGEDFRKFVVEQLSTLVKDALRQV